MCGHIKKLRFPDRPATDAEVEAAVSQYLRKIGDMRVPSAKHQPAFDQAREEIVKAMREMLDGLKVKRAKAVAMAVFKAV